MTSFIVENTVRDVILSLKVVLHAEPTHSQNWYRVFFETQNI